MGVTEVGLLATILFSFENQTPIIKGGQFIEENGGLVLVAPWGTGSDIPLVNRVQGSVQDGNGGIRVRPSLVTLHRNGWLVVEQSVGEIRIRLGKVRAHGSERRGTMPLLLIRGRPHRSARRLRPAILAIDVLRRGVGRDGVVHLRTET